MRAESFTYDPLGNLVSTTDRKLQTTTFTYDSLNRRTQASYADGSGATFTYDAAGRLTLADDSADPHRPIALEYDALDRLLAETTAMGTVTYQYDALGRRTQMTVAGQAPVAYAYDAASRLTQLVQEPLAPVRIAYDAAGRRTLLTLPNQVSTTYQYDPAARLTALLYRNALGLLGDLTYTYDPAGNRTNVGGTFARTLLPDPIPTATYDAANQQLQFGPNTMTFDANGNLAAITEPPGTTTFTWDPRNRLVALSRPNLTANFQYDAFHRRAQKIINAATTQYHYDGHDTIRELLNGTEVSYLRTLNLDEVLGRATTEFYLADGLGSTLNLVDSTGGVEVTYSYDPFGRTATGGVQSPNPFQYTGRENDDIGLYFNRARYYSPRLHRFISVDPIGLRGGINPYAYAANIPTIFVDPLGLQTYALGFGGSAGATAPSGRGITEASSLLAAVDPEGNVGVLHVHGPLVTAGTPGPSSLLGIQYQETDARSINELVGPFIQGGATLAAPVPIGNVVVPLAVSADVFGGPVERGGRRVRVEGRDYIVGLGTPGFSLSGGRTRTELLFSFNIFNLMNQLACGRKCPDLGP